MRERPILFSAPMVRALLAGTKTQTRRVLKHQPEHHWESLPGYRLDMVPQVVEGPIHSIPMAPFDDTSPRTSRMAAWVTCSYGGPGDRLWVRETWYCDDYRCEGAALRAPSPELLRSFTAPGVTIYRADGTCCEQLGGCDHDRGAGGRRRGSPWRPSIHMPRWASRITLEVTGVRVERLQDISPDDALAEGVVPDVDDPGVLWCPFDGSHKRARSPQAAYRALWEDINGGNSWARNPWVWVVEFRRAETGNTND